MRPIYRTTLNMQLQNSRKSAFTLIELFLVFALLTLVGGLLAFNLRQGIASERYLNHVQELAARLQIAQQLMYVAQTDFEVELEKSPEGLICHFQAVQDMSAFLSRLLESTQPLTGIQEVQWRTAEGDVLSQPPIRLTFFSRGALVSRGELKLTSEGDRESRYILITGDGRPIRISYASQWDLLQNTFMDISSQQQLYPEQLREWVNRSTDAEGAKKV